MNILWLLLTHALVFVLGWIIGYVRTSRFYIRMTRPVYGDDPVQPF